jgi:hypothetical protein
MPDGNDRNGEPTIIDLVNDAVIADPDAPGFTAFELFTARRAGMKP